MSPASLEGVYDSPQKIRALLERLGIGLKKRWGQNFMINPGAREKIVGLLDPGPRDSVWEIGAGLGALTAGLLRRAGRLIAFEVDRGLARFLKETFAAEPGFILIEGDVLKTWPEAARRYGVPDRLVGNLPYRSASAILGDFAEAGFRPARLVVTVQRELARRIAARPGGKNYSSFSVLCQSAFRIREQGDLRPGSFYPPPEVVSTIVELEPRADLRQPRDRELFLALVRGLFVSRRKTLRNNLLGWAAVAGGREPAVLPPGMDTARLLEAARAAGIDPSIRGEQLAVEDFVRLADAIDALRSGPTGSASP
jgi:16S rRNA (adenine1518-N6/adenine1519-N6)-dimethyltransferase